jgi:ubiquinone/menaquinone biosynthesis C-methylase UbiE
MKGFREGKTSLNEIELNLLGDISGHSLLHLQCHFGQDSLSLARMGARVTGVDLSDEGIRQARKINEELGMDAQFIQCDLYSLNQHLNETFDIVFTTYGTITWLPDLEKWASIVERYLKPGGRLVLVEFHPMVWMYDPKFTTIEYSYFNLGPIKEVENGSYANRDVDSKLEYIGWNHSLDESISALLGKDLQMRSFREYPFSPYCIFPEMTETAPGQYEIKGLEGKMPLIFSLVMEKPR